MIEVIIVIAILGALSAMVTSVFGYIRSGKTKQSVARIEARLSKMQTDTMTKSGQPYLYIYKTNDGIYMATIDKSGSTDFVTRPDLDSYLNSNPGDSVYIGDANKVTVQINGKSLVDDSAISTKLETNNMLKIGYDKATGAYSVSCDPARFTTNAHSEPVPNAFFNIISFSGTDNYKVHLVQATGKHFIDN